MKTINSAILGSIFGIGAFFLLALAFYIVVFHVFPQPFFAELPMMLTDKIHEINDIEHLRKVALQLDVGARTYLKVTNELFDAATICIIWFFIAISMLCLGNLGYWLRLLREQRGDPIPLW